MALSSLESKTNLISRATELIENSKKNGSYAVSCVGKLSANAVRYKNSNNLHNETLSGVTVIRARQLRLSSKNIKPFDRVVL